MAMRGEEEVGYDPVEGDRGDMETVVVAERERTQNIHLPLVLNALAKQQTNKCRRDPHGNSSTRKDTSNGAPAHRTMPKTETGLKHNLYDTPRAT